jgi:hypothetical protein
MIVNIPTDYMVFGVWATLGLFGTLFVILGLEDKQLRLVYFAMAFIFYINIVFFAMSYYQVLAVSFI